MEAGLGVSSDVRAVLLVGLSGAGKSSVGPLVAARLGWDFVDLDTEIESAAGQTVSEIFASEGEAGFRHREREATERVSFRKSVVIATGGGWVQDPSNWASLGKGILSVYLRVSASTALARIGGERFTRPLLSVPQPEKVLQKLLEARERGYMQANHTVSVDIMSPDEVSDYIVALASGTEGDQDSHPNE